MNDLDRLAADTGRAARKRRTSAAGGEKGTPMDATADGSGNRRTARGASPSRSSSSAGSRAAVPAPQPQADADRPELRPRGPKKGQLRNRYDKDLAHGDPTSLDPEFIVFTGEAVDEAPGRTSRLRYKRGREAPITDEEAANVAWRRAAARLNRVYQSPKSQPKIEQGRLPPTLEQALSDLPVKLPDWDAPRESLHLSVPGRLAEYLAAYADMMNCSVSQLAELWIYEQIRGNVRRPTEIRAAYDLMCEETYRHERAERAMQAAVDDDEDDEYDD